MYTVMYPIAMADYFRVFLALSALISENLAAARFRGNV